MKDVIKFALTCLGIYLVLVLIALLFLNMLVSDNDFFRYIGCAVMVLFIVAAGFFEGGTRGESDSAHERLMIKRLETRGIEPTNAEKQRYYKKWKGAAAALLGLSPILLFALFVFAASWTGNLQEWMTPCVRVALLPFITFFPEDVSITWIYPLFALLFPLSVTVGYLMGPRRFAKLLRAMHDNAEKRKKKQRAKRKQNMQSR